MAGGRSHLEQHLPLSAVAKLTLSFDNGPDPVVTPRVLAVLRAHGLRAHFFVLGKHLATDAGRQLAAQTRAEGHLLGNHSYSHEVPLGDDLRPDAVAREMLATQRLLDPLLAGEPGPRRFRPFGGGGAIGPHLLSPAAVEQLCAAGATCVLWNAVPRDWVEPGAWASRALASLDAEEHTVLVLHDIPGACLDALDGFLTAALGRGAEVTLDLPAACTPILAGRITSDLAPLVRKGIS
jgi:peptidoglycan/xylan/chitin deacetylase (PgdA/CDA1 family)